MSTIHKARFLAEKLHVNKGGSDVERISNTLYNSKITLNPHQIQAALFAFNSPTSKGVMLCDEVGLGKTIEAGIVIAQYWYERKRRIVVISPATLIRQWSSELESKFNLNTFILDSKSIKNELKKGNPFINKNIIITSFHYASSYSEYLSAAGLDLVVIDEAHKLRNVLKKNIIATNIKNGIQNYKKILLTATPLQNNLSELFGLSSILDESFFGDFDMFKDFYIDNYEENQEDLKYRISKFMHRTLRSQVQHYISFPRRITQTYKFVPSENEALLYEKVTNLIQSNPSFGTGNNQTIFISIILRKLLSSSTRAVEATLLGIKNRLYKMVNSDFPSSNKTMDDLLLHTYEITEDLDDSIFNSTENVTYDNDKLKQEYVLVKEALEICEKIDIDHKTILLFEAIEKIFENLHIDKRNKKILIFTESRKTQDYLYEELEKLNMYNIIKFNGSNNDKKQSEIYSIWQKNNMENHNSKSTNMRIALIDYFKNQADIMIATEAGAEGLNMQFCSVVINYDLPWNPQRIEQRIGRVHRYGQTNDVMVINFLNQTNIIDQRVYELLTTKFRLFDDVFGSTDQVLGNLSDDFNFERKIFDIYLTARSKEEIEDYFSQLQKEFEVEISNEMKLTEELFVENFDQQLHSYFDILLHDTQDQILEYEKIFLELIKILIPKIRIEENGRFILNEQSDLLQTGKYNVSHINKETTYKSIKPNDQNGEKLLSYIFNKNIDGGNLIFNVSSYKYKISDLEKLKGTSGLIKFGKVVVDSLDDTEYLIITGITSDGEYLDSKICENLFLTETRNVSINNSNTGYIGKILNKNYKNLIELKIKESADLNSRLYKESVEIISKWADDKIIGIQLEVDRLRIKRNELQREKDYTVNSQLKDKLSEEINHLSIKIRNKWLELAEQEITVEVEKEKYMEALLESKKMRSKSIDIFTINFEVI